MGLLNQTNEIYYEGADGKWDSGDENYGDYQFTSLKNLVNNFMIAYVGEDKIISKIRRTDIAFHAQRAIQEFSFDTRCRGPISRAMKELFIQHAIRVIQ